MKLGVNQTSTNPKAEGTPKKAIGSWGAAAAGTVKTVNVKGGQEKYKGQKSDMSLPQHGGEGKALPHKSDESLLTNKGDYRGPGMSLGK